MAAYILRRLLLIIPTLFGIMLLNFAVIQFAPGGPIEQLIAELQEGATGAEGGGHMAFSADSSYRGRQGIDPALIADLEAQFGFARIICEEGYTGTPTAAAPECERVAIPVWERFGIMLWNYVRLDFGESFRRSASVTDIILEKLPVSVSLGLWATVISYLISIPLGIRKAVKDGTTFDTTTSGVIIAAYALPGFLVPVVLLVLFAGGSYWDLFPLRGLYSDDWAQMGLGEKIVDYFWHIALPVAAYTISGFATLTLLTKNSFLDEIKKQYVMTARAKGLGQTRVLYGHVFRNAMLIVIAGFPAAFVSVFFAGSIFVETVFSLDGLGLLGFESVVTRDYPVVLGTLFIFGLLGLVIKLISDLVYVWIDPRIDFERREG
ncbi:MAG TPA: ABC transporter permease subunit [Paracoccaceae bacterium]|nr:ABC transporter permease subunit [Paracoccaceae bacterium]